MQWHVYTSSRWTITCCLLSLWLHWCRNIDNKMLAKSSRLRVRFHNICCIFLTVVWLFVEFIKKSETKFSGTVKWLGFTIKLFGWLDWRGVAIHNLIQLGSDLVTGGHRGWFIWFSSVSFCALFGSVHMCYASLLFHSGYSFNFSLFCILNIP